MTKRLGTTDGKMLQVNILWNDASLLIMAAYRSIANAPLTAAAAEQQEATMRAVGALQNEIERHMNEVFWQDETPTT